MMLRSWLFVPGDSERKLSHALDAGADAVILDLEDAVTPSRQPIARKMVADFLRAAAGRTGRPEIWVRVNPIVTSAAREDLAAVLPCAPAGIMLPKTGGPADVRKLAGMIDQHDTGGRIGILPIVTEMAEAVLRLGEYGEPLPRVRAVTWGAEDLGTAIGAGISRTPDGRWTAVFQYAEAMVLLVAAALGVPAIDGIYTAHRDLEGLRRRVGEARLQGFTGVLAIHPDQVAAIHDGLRPTDGEIEHARRVVQAFAAAGGVGVVAIDGRMLDRPHLRRAEKLLAGLGTDST
jgi:citrate lyase subunit beta/citryl-CoA lyase